jgi:hypothetical protein
VSTPSGPSKPVSWRTIERVADEANSERLEAKSVEQLDEELRAAGFADDAADALLDAALASAPAAVSRDRAPAPPPARRSWRPSPAVVVVAAAVIAVVVYAFFRNREEPIAPDRWSPPADAVVRAKQAAELRAQALGDCDQGRWVACEQQLDRARTLDPAGEADAKVQDARKRIDAAKHPSPDPSDKPKY